MIEKQSKEEEIQIIIHHWTRIFKDFDKFVVNYVAYTIIIFETFRSSSKLINTFIGHTNAVWSIDYSIFDNCQFICSGSGDKTVCVWDIDNNKQIQSFNEHLNIVYCVKFSSYHNNNIIKIFSPFNGGKYFCSGSADKTIRLWDVETSKSLHIFNGHEGGIWCIDISSLQNNNNNIGLIGGNGYTICSGSIDKTIKIWDIETTKQFNVLKGHKDWVRSVKYGSNELLNTILSGSNDESIRLWDIRSGQRIQIFNGHNSVVWSVEYSPFIINNNINNSSVICSGSYDNTIRFWDIRSNKKHLYMIKGNDKGIYYFKFIELKKKNIKYDLSLCYGSGKGHIRIWR
ncbi:WD-40 repeat protein [Reticulomyxa filosa]|uniref:WD-40 repeat protein n=1 Tax=Reticulomyxa filosa TaxID=46433 RepID=X6MB05_RETFI|nr:WD-40 repeat protein [Reticulomyxa filosa]|eukprot:ETO10826.1 WD-40 repeat protein [Reticulomyxa filosa]